MSQAKTIDPLSDEIAGSIPRLYKAAQDEMKVRVEGVLQDQTAIDYYDILESQTAIQNSAKNLKEQIESGDLDSPELTKYFSAPWTAIFTL